MNNEPNLPLNLPPPGDRQECLINAVEQVCRQFSQNPKKVRDLFKFTAPVDRVVRMLAAEYLRIVGQNGFEPVISQSLQYRIIEIANHMCNPGHKSGVMFYGGCGNGKTTLMTALYNVAITLSCEGMFKHLGNIRWGFEFAFVTATELCEDWKDKRNHDYYYNLGFLVIDDLGTEPVEVLDYGNATFPFISLIERRYAERRFTAVTSNLDRADIRPRYKDRIADRFNEMFKLFLFTENSYRK